MYFRHFFRTKVSVTTSRLMLAFAELLGTYHGVRYFGQNSLHGNECPYLLLLRERRSKQGLYGLR